MLKLPCLVCCLLLSVCLFAQVTNGLIAKFTFNNGTLESEQGEFHPIAAGIFFSEDRFGNEGKAVYFQGSQGSYLNLGTDEQLKPAIGSISLWFKMDNFVYSGRGYTGNPIILTKSHSGDDFFEGYTMTINVADKKLHVCNSLTTHEDSIQVVLHSPQQILPGKWYHSVFCYDDDYITFYLDGLLIGKISKNFHSVFLKTDSVIVGHSANKKNKRFFNGSVDDISIFNRVLSPDEVDAIFNAPDPNRFRPILKLTGIIFIITLSIFFTGSLFAKGYRRALIKEKEKNKLLRQMHDLEVKIKKAQMNPHFIFNAMSSVQQLILKGDLERAHKYLGKFSRLLRDIIESQDEYTSIEDEISMLGRYIEIESLRFSQTLKYEVTADIKIISSGLKIPQMLIQPIVENAIWHGLLPKKGDKTLQIRFEQFNTKAIRCIVEDNGVGRTPVRNFNPVKKGKSLALAFIKHRLELMQKESGEPLSLSITDKKDPSGLSEGTIVKLIMPVIYI